MAEFPVRDIDSSQYTPTVTYLGNGGERRKVKKCASDPYLTGSIQADRAGRRKKGVYMIPSKKIGITGKPGIGKTEVVTKVGKMLEKEGITVGGMITESVKDDGDVVGLKCVNWVTEAGKVFAHKDFCDCEEVEGMGIQQDALEGIGVKAINWACEKADVIIIDEVDKRVVVSDAFVKAVEKSMDADKRLLITLHKRSRDPLLQDIRRRDDIRVLDVTRVNRNLLPYKMMKILRGGHP